MMMYSKLSFVASFIFVTYKTEQKSEISISNSGEAVMVLLKEKLEVSLMKFSLMRSFDLNIF